MKLIVAILLCVLHGLASAQVPTYNGVSIKKGLDAYDRIYVTNNASDNDFKDATMLIAYISGMLAVHRMNNLTAMILFSANNVSKEEKTKQKMSEVDSVRLKTLLLLTPLLALPDNVPTEQLVAILRKFLTEHPERWGQQAATLITDALVEAFQRK